MAIQLQPFSSKDLKKKKTEKKEYALEGVGKGLRGD